MGGYLSQFVLNKNKFEEEVFISQTQLGNILWTSPLIVNQLFMNLFSHTQTSVLNECIHNNISILNAEMNNTIFCYDINDDTSQIYTEYIPIHNITNHTCILLKHQFNETINVTYEEIELNLDGDEFNISQVKPFCMKKNEIELVSYNFTEDTISLMHEDNLIDLKYNAKGGKNTWYYVGCFSGVLAGIDDNVSNLTENTCMSNGNEYDFIFNQIINAYHKIETKECVTPSLSISQTLDSCMIHINAELESGYHSQFYLVFVLICVAFVIIIIVTFYCVCKKKKNKDDMDDSKNLNILVRNDSFETNETE
jgi:hypothetical protein